MVVGHFLKWVHTARVQERAAAAAALARAYIDRELPFEDRCAAEAALTLLLDDVSAKVRLAMAEVLSLSHHAPVQIISALASDQPEVAGLVLARSPLLTDGPYAEVKEHLGGLSIVRSDDYDRVLRWAERIAGATGFPVEVRPFVDEHDPGQQPTTT